MRSLSKTDGSRVIEENEFKKSSIDGNTDIQAPATSFFQHLLKDGTWNNVDPDLLQEYARLSIQCQQNSVRNGSQQNAEQEELCLRRAKDAERKRLSRMNQSEEEKQRIREVEADRRRKRRAYETGEQRQRRLDRDRQRHRDIRLRESSEERRRRQARDRLRHQLKRCGGGQVLHHHWHQSPISHFDSHQCLYISK